VGISVPREDVHELCKTAASPVQVQLSIIVEKTAMMFVAMMMITTMMMLMMVAVVVVVVDDDDASVGKLHME